jgi:biotin synthase
MNTSGFSFHMQCANPRPRSIRPVNTLKLMDVEYVAAAARTVKQHGATHRCIGSAWRAPKERDIAAGSALRKLKWPGLETCFTLGMLSQPQAKSLKDAGLDHHHHHHNHNFDTAPKPTAA